MTDRPILFSAPMVRAILAGTKTQTRRAIKGAPDDWAPMQPQPFWTTVVRSGIEEPGEHAYGAGNEEGDCWITCPYGQPGDRLWVRETWAPNDGTAGGYLYRADHGSAAAYYNFDLATGVALHRCDRWRPSIHMPRAASRINLEITGVRVERLQDISDMDALAEGIDREQPSYPKLKFSWLWKSINGDDSWDANPWVWVVEFKRFQAPDAAPE